MKNVLLNLNNISLRDTFHDFSISFIENYTTSISGPNNCGKTTLIRILAGIDKIDNIDITNNGTIQYVIPEQITFMFPKAINELEYLQESVDTNIKQQLIKELKISKSLSKYTQELSRYEIIKIQLLICLLKRPNILLLDDIYKGLSKMEIELIKKTLYKYKKNNDLTIIQTVSELTNSLDSDYLYIIKNSKIILEGNPLEVISHDNIINKAGLSLPFLVDLSVKLKDYNLIDNIITDEKELVEELWK